MKILIVYFSKFGNTYKLTETIAEAMASNGVVSTIDFNQLSVNNLSDIDLVVMGCPTHNMNLPKAVKPVFDRLPKSTLSGTPAAAFDTSYKMSWWLNHFTASKRLAKKLHKLGGKLVVPAEIFHVTEREGPLYEGELKRAQEWATFLHEKATNQLEHLAV